jgi:pSer/pThr/pTyr-binding forkhead associated (FHA) protein
VRRDQLIIGSAPDAQIVIPVETVDPHHASLTFDGDQLRLADLGSRHGTFRNGHRLLGPLQVFPGDRIGLGPDVVLILDGEEPQARRAEDDEPEPDAGELAPG